MIGKNFIVKYAENFSKRNAKNFTWKFLTIIKSSKKKMKWFFSIMMSMTTFTQNPTNFVRIYNFIWIFAWNVD